MKPSKMLPHSSKCQNPTMNAPTKEKKIFENHLGTLMPRFAPISVNHLLSMDAEHAGNFEEAYRYQNCYLNDVIAFLRCEPGQTWNFSLMNTACQDLRYVAKKADEVSQTEETYTEKVAKSLKALYKICLEDDGTISGRIKKRGILIPINHILRIYFKLEKYELCNKVIKSVEPKLPRNIYFQPQLVMFKFHKGRLALVDRRYCAALRSLSFAYDLCSPKNDTNKRMILVYLLPVEMIMNIKNLVTKKIADKFNLTIFWDLYRAIAANNLRKVDKIFENNKTFFSNEGLLVILDELKDIVYLSILKKLYFTKPSNSLSIASYQAGLNMVASKPFNDSEILDLLTSLRHKRKINAFVPRGKGNIIFYHENAFPDPFQYAEEEPDI